MKLVDIRRILVIRLDAIGDVVLTSPFLRELRRNFPKAYISLLVAPIAYNLVELCPYVDEVFIYDFRKYDVLEYLRFLRLAFVHLREKEFDLALIPRWDVDLYRATFIAFLSGARLRVGYSEKVSSYKAIKNKGFDLFLTHAIESKEAKHEVERNLDILRFLGLEVLDDSLELWTGGEDERFADSLVRGLGLDRKMLVAIAPGAGQLKKRWPVERFLEVCKWLMKEYGAFFIILGGKGEERLGAFLEEGLKGNAVDLVSKTTLRQAGALLKRVKLFIGNDSSLMHMAAASRIPVLALFCHPEDGDPNAFNSPLRFGPWKTESVVLQPKRALPPCSLECKAGYPHCILGIDVDQVKEAVSFLLNGIIEKDERNN
ncbi:MAG: glycosyltransferase family 9 protein [Synergistetes bacterium]|nr:MAG: Lipopolysaccharide heptosyltransferase II [bacterium 42_11]MBC7332021.1 glycosyltransferase family 9 protein [Synergistota bacterium]MDK2871170.1 hypothetical protein [bacterium]